MRLLSFKFAATIFFLRYPEPTRFTRDEVLQEMELMHMEENLPGSAASGCGGLGTRVLLQQRVTHCLSIETVLSVLHGLGVSTRHLEVLMFLWRSLNHW